MLGNKLVGRHGLADAIMRGLMQWSKSDCVQHSVGKSLGLESLGGCDAQGADALQCFGAVSAALVLLHMHATDGSSLAGPTKLRHVASPQTPRSWASQPPAGDWCHMLQHGIPAHARNSSHLCEP